MPPRGKAPDIVRIVEGVKGRVHVPLGADDPLRLRPHRPVGAQAHARGEHARRPRRAGRALLPNARGDARRGPAARSRSSRSTRASASRSSSRGSPRTRTCREAIDPEQALADTESFWREWSGQCDVDLPPRLGCVVRRSLIVLKALTYEPTGGIVAAATTSLPEWIGSRAQLGLPLLLAARRDAHAARPPPGQPRGGGDRLATLAAARGRGRSGRHPDHVRRRRRAAADGVRAAVARRVRGLASRCGSATRRASSSSSTSTARCSTRSTRRASAGSRSTRRPGGSSSAVLDHLEDAWREPDEGIWEIRGERAPLHPLEGDGVGGVRPRGPDRRGTGSRRAGRPLASVRDEIHAEVCERGFDAELGSFTQSYGSKELDASLLLLPARRLPSRRPTRGSAARSRRSSASCCRTASSLRYRTQRGAASTASPPGEGVFLPCSFWLANCYELLGRHDEALELFERLARPRERPRPAVRGVRPEGEAPARQLPAGVHAPHACGHRLQRRAAPAFADAPALRRGGCILNRRAQVFLRVNFALTVRAAVATLHVDFLPGARARPTREARLLRGPRPQRHRFPEGELVRALCAGS